MKPFLKTLLLLFICFQVKAQVPQWTWVATQSDSNSYTPGKCAVDQAGNIYVSYTSNVYFSRLSKYDKNGKIVWTDTFSTSYEAPIYSIAFNQKGNLMIAGNYHDEISIGSIVVSPNMSHGNFYNTFISEIDTSGQVIWIKTIGGNMSGDAMALDNNDNIYITSYFEGPNALYSADSIGNYPLYTTGGTDIAFSKLDQLGNVLWVKLFGSDGDDWANALVVDGEKVFIGGSYSGDSLICDSQIIRTSSNSSARRHVPSEIWLARFDTTGQLIWVKSAGGKGGDEAQSMAVSNNGSLYITGVCTDTAYFDGIPTLNPRHGLAPFLAKYESDGSFKWIRTINGKGRVKAAAVAIDAQRYVYTTGLVGDSALIQNVPLKSNGMFVVKWDDAGGFVWAQNATITTEGASICMDDAGSVYISGSYRGYATFGSINVSDPQGQDMFLAKLSQPTAIPQLQNSENEITIYPNPTSKQFVVTYSKNEFTNLQLTDIQGKAVYNQSLNSTQKQAMIQLPQLAPGLYLLHLTGPNTSTARKLVIQ